MKTILKIKHNFLVSCALMVIAIALPCAVAAQDMAAMMGGGGGMGGMSSMMGGGGGMGGMASMMGGGMGGF